MEGQESQGCAETQMQRARGYLAQAEGRLSFRRLFCDTADEKDWDMPDILMGEGELIVPVETRFGVYLPAVIRD